MNNIHITLNNIQTHLITWDNPASCDGKEVIICITGNPGLPDFYIEFASELHRATDLPVCVIGQAGHEEVPDTVSNVLEGQQHLFNLEGQLEHKLDLINNYIDMKSKLHLIGHSIGAWLLVELLHRHDIMDRVSSVNLLFPTLQKMAETKNGIYLNNIVRRLHLLVLMLFSFMHMLPESIRVFLIGLYLKFHSLPPHYYNRIKKYLNPRVGEKVLFLAYEEMDNVTVLNKEGISKIKSITNVIYSVRDDWAPVHFMDDLRQFQPQLTLTEVNINHTFVLKSSERVAEMVVDYIKTKTKKPM